MTRLDAALAAVAAVLVVLVAAETLAGLAAGLVGLCLVGAALWTGRRGVAWLSAAPLVAAPGVAALSGAGAGVVLVGTPAALVAWDATHRAVRLRGFERVRPGASVVHAAGIAAVGTAVAAGVAFGRPVLRGLDPLPTAALLVAAFALAAALRE